VFPLKDSAPLRVYPFVTIILVLLNVLLFVVELQQGPHIYDFVLQFAVTPVNLWNWPAHPEVILTLLSSNFLHAGWVHLGGNMLYLWIFGRKVEGVMGPWRYLGFYLLGGALASVIDAIFSVYSHIPSLGASGAIAAVLGAYLLYYPKARVWVWAPFVFWLGIFPVPAFLGLGFWFVLQLFSGVLTLDWGASQAGGTAWWAHIGGFVVGMAMSPFLRLPPPRDVRQEQIELGGTPGGTPGRQEKL
jgi:membrane associated rhomboid family serine protease